MFGDEPMNEPQRRVPSDPKDSLPTWSLPHDQRARMADLFPGHFQSSKQEEEDEE